MSFVIEKKLRSKVEDATFTILIPTWNNLKYLQLCVRSLRANSALRHQLIVFVNEGSDGTLEWVKSQCDIDYLYSPENVGICYALNACRELVATSYILYANDDMYFCPHWDTRLWQVVALQPTKRFMLSCTMIERSGHNPCCRIADFGDSPDTFRETELLAKCETLVRENWSGSTWPPNLTPVEMWDLVGGMSIEFSPGMYSDPDLSMKLWSAGVRTFVGVGNSLVYHFSRVSTKRITKNKGHDMFLAKWKISANLFMHNYLRIGETVTNSNLTLPTTCPKPHLSLSQKIGVKFKLLINLFKPTTAR